MDTRMSTVISKLFGSSGSKICQFWYWLLIPAFLAFVMTFKKGDVQYFIIQYISIYGVMFLLFLSYFFLNIPGVKIIKSWRHLRKIKKKLDPVALAISGSISSKCDYESGNFYLYYSFQDGNFITLTVWEDGFNVFTPNWNPGYEKSTEGFDIFIRAIEKTRISK